jgi:hypothetical protein
MGLTNAKLTVDDIVRNTLFVVTLAVTVAYLLTGFPFGPLFDSTAELRALFRISIASFYLIVLLRTRDGLPLLFGYEAIRDNVDSWSIRAFYLQIVCSVFLIIGLFTELAAVLLFVGRVLVLEESKKFGLENTIYQMVIVHLPFLGLGEVLSVDQLLGVPSVLVSPVMFNSLFVVMGTMFISGSFHKMGSSLWRSGAAVDEFLKIPYIRVAPLAGIQVPLPSFVSKTLSYSMIAAQFLLLFSAWNKYLLVFLSVIFIGFAISAFSFVDLSYIGQFLLAVFGLLGGAVVLNFDAYPSFFTLGVDVTAFTLLALCINTLGILTILRTDLVLGTPLRKLSRLLSGHNAPVKPFNEHHYFGVHTFRLLRENDDGTKTPVLEVFDEDGWQKQFLYPRCYETCVWSVTDYCLGRHNEAVDGESNIPELKDLCYTGLRSTGDTVGTIYLQIKIYNDDVDSYVDSEWVTLGKCVFDADSAMWELLNEPSRIEDHPRLSFEAEYKNA